MTALTSWYCNICNTGAHDDVARGFAQTPLGEVPPGWLVGATVDDAPADVCTACAPTINAANRPTPKPAELPPSALKGVTPGGWPAHASPFGATPDGFPRG